MDLKGKVLTMNSLDNIFSHYTPQIEVFPEDLKIASDEAKVVLFLDASKERTSRIN